MIGDTGGSKQTGPCSQSCALPELQEHAQNFARMLRAGQKDRFVCCHQRLKSLPLSSAQFSSNISNTRDSVSTGYPNIEKRVENTTRSGVFLTKFEVFG